MTNTINPATQILLIIHNRYLRRLLIIPTTEDINYQNLYIQAITTTTTVFNQLCQPSH